MNTKRFREYIPEELKALSQWAVYKTYWQPDKGKKGKAILKPFDIKDPDEGKWAKSNDSSTWRDFDSALSYAQKNGCAGLSFALTKESNITCIDLDKCADENGRSTSLARKILALFPETYTETSASGNGLHIFVRGDLTENGAYKNRTVTPDGEIEVYSAGRFISMTGNSVDGVRKIATPSDFAVDELQKMLGRRVTPMQTVRPSAEYAASDAEVLERIRKSKRAAEYEALARGDNITGDRSRNDWQMAKILAFFTSGDAKQVAWMMRESGINRPDKPDVYYERTAEKAVDSLTLRYGDGADKPWLNKGKQGKTRETLIQPNLLDR